MTRRTWWQSVKQFLGAVTRRDRRPDPRWRPYQPRLEDLEGRLAPTVTLSISNPAPFPKPESGQLMGLFVVTRSGDLMPLVQVNYQTQDGSGPTGAHAGTDYVATSGTLCFFSNQTTATITVPIIGNNLFQTNKTFTVSLSNPPSPSADFAPQQTFTTIDAATSVAVGDFTGDGKLDLAITDGYPLNSVTTVSVLLKTTPAGATTPSFASQQTFTIPGSGQSSVAVADFNGDDKPDLAVGSGNAVSVLLNTTPAGATTPSFAPQQIDYQERFLGPVAVGDFNGDGKLDLAIQVSLGTTLFVTGLDDQVYGHKSDGSGNPLGGYFLMQTGRQNGFVVAG